MKTVNITINRIRSFSNSIVGELSVNGKRICYTLELPWLWNEEDRSCVPPGTYNTTLRRDKPDGWRIQLEGVEWEHGVRGGVQIHVGNWPGQTVGCVLVGTDYKSNAVLHSEKAYGLLKQAIYGTSDPKTYPTKTIRVEFKGILATPWGDFPRQGGSPAA